MTLTVKNEEILDIYYLLLNNANNDDLSLFLSNCFNNHFEGKYLINISQYKSKENFENKLYDDYKEILQGIILYCIKDNTPENKLIYSIIIEHLKAIYFYYHCFGILFYEKNPKGTTDSLDLILDKALEICSKICHNNKLSNPITKSELTQILHEMIRCYNENNFYYYFDIGGNKIYKIEIVIENDEVKSIKTPYELVNSDRNPHIIDYKTGLKVSIGRRIKDILVLKNDEYYANTCTLANFKGVNERIINALNYKPEPCIWCNPTEDIQTKKCNNCMNLLDDLKYLASVYKLPLKNFKEAIESISLDSVKNVAELRKKRKENLLRTLHNIRNSKNYKMIDELKSTINKAFSE